MQSLDSISRRNIAFLDILGMRAHLSKADREAEVAKILYQVLSSVLEEPEAHSVVPHIVTGQDVSMSFSGWRSEPDFNITSISDSLVISAPITSPVKRSGRHSKVFAAYKLLSICFWIQRSLLKAGILTRGAISSGNLLHKDNIVIGSGLVEAYEAESAVSIYPRTIITDSFTDHLCATEDLSDIFYMKSRIGHLLKRDTDQFVFVDYLGIDVMAIETNWPEELGAIEIDVKNQLSLTKDLRVQQKLGWLHRYVKESQKDGLWNAEHTEHKTEGNIESAYPREF